MKRMLRILLTCLTALALFTLCACGPSSEGPDDSTPPDETETVQGSDAVEESEEPEVSQEPQEIPLGDDATVGELAYGREVY